MNNYKILQYYLAPLTPEQSVKVNESDTFWTSYDNYDIYLSHNDAGDIVAVSLLSGSVAWGFAYRANDQESIRKDLLRDIQYFIGSRGLERKHRTLALNQVDKASDVLISFGEIEIKITKREARKLLLKNDWKQILNLFQFNPNSKAFVILFRHSSNWSLEEAEIEGMDK
ncbi:hypothetical protein PN466_00830 [Roseofilum reptotaenium CS-1145]|uniref:Uncharacterized protein n=1 Tax=Roseofilum reptotaenium AO1-A TaxID=1925591 RepID=A0A1L9QKM7_9CYAN|nr:hypothetical protein [Roseofilum reptotaenium]MDB9515506.1 hypothetical protein [Roseofilum reptotaenium CS-1145]OJJ16943.1 hypothetical protein BI308_23290 [Roseofilum reptotaenium AO1-A]